MTIDQFWETVEKARGGSSPELPSTPPESLEKAIEKLPVEDVKEFLKHFYACLIELNRWNIWGAGYVIHGGMGDDSFHYFRSWIIGKGRSAYNQALADPDLLGPWIDDPEEVDNELLEYVALEVLESRGVEDDPREDVEGSPDDEPQGEPFDEEEVERSYPRLAAKFA